MSLPVTIENAHLRLEVWPQFGAKVSSIIDKADGHELLFAYPSELPTRCQYAMPYRDGWPAGWDECFPAIASGAYPLHPYEAIIVPDRGELWALPTTAVPTRDGITTVWHGLRFGYRLTRKLYLQDNAIICDYTLVNLAPFDFRFVWAMHALLSVVSAVEIDFGMPVKLVGPHLWPTLDERTAFDRYDRLPEGFSWKVYSDAPISRHAIVRYPDRGRQLRIEYVTPPDTGPTAHWGIWINTGGWEGQHNVSIAPTTGRNDLIASSIADDSAAGVGPAGVMPNAGRTSWSVMLSVDQYLRA